MRTMPINCKTFYYATYSGNTMLKDSDGNYTGETEQSYSNPISAKGNISASKGSTEAELFGTMLDYDKVIVMDASVPTYIDENSVLWIDTMPDLDDDGATDTPHDYIVKKVAESINYIAYAVRKVDVS